MISAGCTVAHRHHHPPPYLQVRLASATDGAGHSRTALANKGVTGGRHAWDFMVLANNVIVGVATDRSDVKVRHPLCCAMH